MKILVLPRDANPYQGLLYREMCRLGVQVTYLGGCTPSHTLNILLLPLEVAFRRLFGARLVHLHWVFAFSLPGTDRFPFVRWISYIWFVAWIRICRILGVHLVWTAHNVLPHDPVFLDDASARRELVDASDLVLAHSEPALTELAAIGAVPRRSAVIPHGPIFPIEATESLRIPGTGGGPRRFLFVGRVKGYKGIEDLLAAFSAMPEDVPAHLTVAGRCDDAHLRARLAEFASRDDTCIRLHLEHLAERDLTRTVAESDVVVLPFRKVTTSGSAMLALSHGRPLIVPDLPAMADLPDAAVLRYDRGVQGLSAAMISAARASSETLAAMSDAARGYAYRITWEDIAQRTLSEMTAALDATPSADVFAQGIGFHR